MEPSPVGTAETSRLALNRIAGAARQSVCEASRRGTDTPVRVERSSTPALTRRSEEERLLKVAQNMGRWKSSASAPRQTPEKMEPSPVGTAETEPEFEIKPSAASLPALAVKARTGRPRVV